MNTEEQIEEAKAERSAIGDALERSVSSEDMNALNRLWRRADARVTALIAVRDGRMVPVFATVCVDADQAWRANGGYGYDHDDAVIMENAGHEPGDAVTVLRGYAHVPSTQVHEVEADSEVPS